MPAKGCQYLGRSRLSIVLSVPGWVYLAGCGVGLLPMAYVVVTEGATGSWSGAGEAIVLWLLWPSVLFFHGPWSELPRPVILTIVGSVVLTGWLTFVVEWRRRHHWRRYRKTAS